MPLRHYVDETLKDLLEISANNLSVPDIIEDVNGFTCIGGAESIPVLGQRDTEVFVWHVPEGILPLTGAELTRWSLDAPSGLHWILSQRTIQGEYEHIDGINIEIWGPEEIATWIGESVLSGDLIAYAPKFEVDEIEVRKTPSEELTSPKTLRPLIDPEVWISQRGMEGVGLSPVLLDARLWLVAGDLKGPTGQLEPGTWKIFEDPWALSLQIIENEEILKSADLRCIGPNTSSWITKERFSQEVVKLLSVRRRGEITKSESSSSVRSTLLQKWEFDLDGSNIRSTGLYIPGWIVHFEEEKLLHGRNGRLF